MTAQTEHEEQLLDLAILGGGLSGLMLAHMLEHSGLRVAIFEARDHYQSDRTWSFWQSVDEQPLAAQQGRWSTWAVRRPGLEADWIQAQATGIRYVSIDAAKWQRDQQQRIAKHPAQELVMGARIVELNFDQAHVGLTLERSGHKEALSEPAYSGLDASAPDPKDEPLSYRARMVIDTRSGAPRLSGGGYAQHFMGAHVHTSSPCFNPTRAVLMDFRTQAMPGDGIDFLYLLPYSETSALIEVTRFAAQPPSALELKQWLDTEITRACHSSADARPQTLHTEMSSLPMQVTRAPVSQHPGRYLTIGQAAGANRAATGYAFCRIRRQCRALADMLVQEHKLPLVAPDPGGAVERCMDSLFLRVIQARPDFAPELFTQLFERCPAERLVRFLDGEPTLADRASLISACVHPSFFAGLLKR